MGLRDGDTCSSTREGILLLLHAVQPVTYRSCFIFHLKCLCVCVCVLFSLSFFFSFCILPLDLSSGHHFCLLSLSLSLSFIVILIHLNFQSHPSLKALRLAHNRLSKHSIKGIIFCSHNLGCHPGGTFQSIINTERIIFVE